MTILNPQVAKTLFTASALVAFIALPLISSSQYMEHWRHEGPEEVAGGEYFKQNRLTGMTYNPVTDNVLVAALHLHTVQDASQVLIFDPDDGSVKSPMTTTGVSGGDAGLKKIAVVDRGSGDYSVYLCTATEDAKEAPGSTGPGPEPFRVYRWEGSNGTDESMIGAPTQVYYNRTEDSPLHSPGASWTIGPPMPAVPRTVFGVGYSMHGIHDHETAETKLYIASTYGVIIMRVDETNGNISSVERLDLNDPEGGVAHSYYGVTLDEYGNFFAGGRVYNPLGGFVSEFNQGVVPSFSSQFRIMEQGDRRFMGFLMRTNLVDSSSSAIRVIDTTYSAESSWIVAMPPPATSPATNPARWGDIALDTRRGRFIGLITNNMLLSFSQVEVPLLVTLAEFGATVNEPGGTVTVQWETATEIDNVGFNVYRTSANNSSAETRVNATLIPAASSAGQGAAYSLVDAQAMAPGESRSYVLEDVDANGKQTRHAPATVTREASNSAVSEWMLY